jgi:hypothetical protein
VVAPHKLPPEKRRSGPVFVYVWFDIEDYVTEESDGLPIIAAGILAKHGVKATCKMVAEKVRVLLERERYDVISAIKAQDVGYHLDTHSRHPTVYEYLADKDTLDGASEFEERERKGLELVERVFGRRASCYGHPGPAWGTHYYPAMKRMGIPVYLDESPIVNVEDRPYWYCGVLNLNGANQNFLKFDYTFESPSGLPKLKGEFERVHDRLVREGGGSISFLFHLHTAINKEFWDAVNFSRGENRMRGQYVRPPVQPPDVTERAWRDFDEIIGYMRSFEDVRFITASDAAGIFRKSRPTMDRRRIKKVLEEMGSDVSYVKVGDDFLSPSELFYLVAKCLASFRRTGKVPERVRLMEPLGPKVTGTGSPASGRRVKVRDLLSTSVKVAKDLESSGRLPESVAVDGAVLTPGDFMVTSAKVLRSAMAGKAIPEETGVVRARFLQSRLVKPKEFESACRWAVLPEGFSAPRILEEIVQQTWTLRPAVASARSAR